MIKAKYYAPSTIYTNGEGIKNLTLINPADRSTNSQEIHTQKNTICKIQSVENHQILDDIMWQLVIYYSHLRIFDTLFCKVKCSIV